MAGTGAGYDLSVTTFSVDGRVYQVDYAHKAVENSGTTLAICCKDGIIFAVEKFLASKMLVPGTNRRVLAVHKNAAIAVAGFSADARQIANRAQSEAKQYKNAYCEDIPPAILAERLGLFVHAYTLYWSMRPFGCSVLLGCVEPSPTEPGKVIPSLFTVDPSGIVYKYKANASGKAKQAAKTEVEKLLAENPDGITCADALLKVAKIINKVHDEKDRDFELEVSWICPATNYEHAHVSADVLAPVEAEAKRQLEEEAED